MGIRSDFLNDGSIFGLNLYRPKMVKEAKNKCFFKVFAELSNTEYFKTYLMENSIKTGVLWCSAWISLFSRNGLSLLF